MARRDITPPLGIRHRNWGAQTHEVAEGIHRPLTVTVMTLQSAAGEMPIVIAAVDLGWWRSAEDEAFVRRPVLKALGLAESHLLVCLSHTHAGPTTHLGDEDLPGGDLVRPYLSQVADAIQLAAEEALRGADEAILDVTQGAGCLAFPRDVEDPGGTRYLVGTSPFEVVGDDPLTVGRVTRRDGRLRATLMHYACHPTSLGWENRQISPDYVGAAREVMEAETGVPCLFLQGWSGDLAPIQQYSGDVAVADRNGRRLGLSALTVFLGMREAGTELRHDRVVESGASLQVLATGSFTPSRKLSAKNLNVEVRLKVPAVQAASPSTAYEQEREARRRQLWASIPPDFRLPVWFVRAGDIVIPAIPGEMTSRYSFVFEEEDAALGALPLNVVNGWYGYLPEKEVYDRDQYSVWQSPFAAPSAEMVVEALLWELRRSA